MEKDELVPTLGSLQLVIEQNSQGAVFGVDGKVLLKKKGGGS